MEDKKLTKSDYAYKTIGEVAKELNLIDKKTGNLQTHTLRYWETQFKQIKPTIKAGNRRYYTKENLKIIKTIKHLLRDKGLTINGAKKILESSNMQSLDDNINLGIYRQNQNRTKTIKDRVKNISKIITQLKKLK